MLVRSEPRRRAYARSVRRAVALLSLVAAVGLGGACASPGYDAGKLQSELRRAGLTSDQAVCVTNAMEDTFDVNQLASHSDPTVEEDATTRAILAKCGVKLPAPPK
jgi:hypothetical protein